MEKKRHPGSIPWSKEEPEDPRKYPLTPEESYKKEKLEGLCGECGEGILELAETRPGYRENTQVYECSACGHRESFP